MLTAYITVNDVKFSNSMFLIYLLLFCHSTAPPPFKRFPILVYGLLVVFRTAREKAMCSCV